MRERERERGTDAAGAGTRHEGLPRRREPHRRHGVAVGLVVALAAATLTGLQTTAAAAAATTVASSTTVTGTGAWGVLATTSSPVESLSCGTPTTCLAVSATTLLRTTDGGVT